MCREIENFPATQVDKIVGGTLGKSEGWPWFVKLSIQDYRRRMATCGGTIIASHLILTGELIIL